MSKKGLEAVKLSRRDSCLTYALKRTGLYSKVKARELEDLECEFKPTPFDESRAERGMIVLWQDKREFERLATEIGADTTIIANDCLIGITIGVVEDVEPIGDNNVIGYSVLFSDCATTGNPFGIPEIRLRKMSNETNDERMVVRSPDYFLNLKSVLETKKKEIKRFLGVLEAKGTDVSEFVQISKIDLDKPFESIKQMMSDNRGFFSDFRNEYKSAISYLGKNDPSLELAMKAFKHYGHKPDELSSTLLATCLSTKNREDAFDINKEAVEDFFQKLQKDEKNIS